MPTPSTRSPSPPTKRLLQELRDHATDPLPFLAHLGPANDDQLFEWTAVMRGPEGTAYESGLWHLTISLPPTYPLHPPTIKFTTKIIHPNISFSTGEICLDLLGTSPSPNPPHPPGMGEKEGKGGAWTPAYTVARTLEAVWLMLRYPEVDSPLNVDVAVLLREGDKVGAEGLVRWGCGEWRWRG